MAKALGSDAGSSASSTVSSPNFLIHAHSPQVRLASGGALVGLLRCLVRVCLVVVTMAPFMAFAQGADISVRFESSDTAVTQTRVPEVRFVVRNLGPSAATGVVARTPAAFPVPAQELAITSTCSLVTSGAANAVEFSWSIGTLAAGAEATCTVTLRALPLSMSRVMSFLFLVSSDSSDPVSNNNIAGPTLAVSSFDLVSDIRLSVQVLPSAGILPTDGTARLQITLSNRGPDRASFTQAVTDYYDSPFFIPGYPFELFSVPEDPCSTRIAVELSSSQVFTGPANGLGVGESITCVIGISPNRASNVGNYAFGVSSYVSGFGSRDPDLSNNSTAVVLAIGSVEPVPSSDSRMLVLLAVLILTVGTLASLRSRRV